MVEDRWVHAAMRLTSIESIHVTFTMIVTGAYSGEAKMCNNVLQEGWLSPTERASVSAISLH